MPPVPVPPVDVAPKCTPVHVVPRGTPVDVVPKGTPVDVVLKGAPIDLLRRGVQMLLGFAGALLAACDDGTVITRVQVWGDARSYFTTAGAEGVATEVHGTPFARVSAGEVVARLKPPPGMAQDVRFRLVRQGERAEGSRLLLVFNRTDVPDSMRDCRRSARGQTLPVEPNPAQEVGFTVTASLCDAEARVATAHMDATRTRADDAEEFARVMRLLLIHLTDRGD